jgi:hypothetical protein
MMCIIQSDGRAKKAVLNFMNQQDEQQQQLHSLKDVN